MLFRLVIVFLLFSCACWSQTMPNDFYSISMYFYDSEEKIRTQIHAEKVDLSNSYRYTTSSPPVSFLTNRFLNSFSNDSTFKNINSKFSKRQRVDYQYGNIYPFSANVKLEVYANGRAHKASGTIVSKNIVITAGHAIYLYKYGWADSIIVTSNYSDKENQIKSKSIKYYIFKDFADSFNIKYDIGLLVLEEAIGIKTGYIGLSYNDEIDYFLNTGYFYHLSYPSKSFIPSEKNLYNGKIQFLNFGRFDSYNSKYDWVRYKQSAPKGESGSSFFAKNGSNYYLYGVLSMGVSSFVLISKEKFYTLKKIINSYK